MITAAMEAEIRANITRGEELERLIDAGVERGQALSGAAGAAEKAARALPWWAWIRRGRLMNERARKITACNAEIRANAVLLAERQGLIDRNAWLLALGGAQS